jgi:signal transduction histidine kinase
MERSSLDEQLDDEREGARASDGLVTKQATTAWIVLDALPAAVLIVDGRGRVRYANRRVAALVGKEQDALAGLAASELFGPGVDLDALLEAAARGHSLELPRGSRGKQSCAVELAPISELVGEQAGGASDLWAVTVRELGELSRLRDERDRLLRLASAGAQIPTLLHELRKPLANLTAVLEGVDMLGCPADARLIQALLVEARRMALMLETTGASTRALRAAQPSRVDRDLRECRSLLARVAWRRGVALDWQVHDMPPLELDTGVLRSLLCNLIANAIDACNPSDTIEVDARLVAEDDGAPTRFELRVSDNGAGMSPEVLRRCTEPFYSTKTGGCGIGLALCRDVVEAAGGSLIVDSVPEVGTSVILRVPL